MQKEILLHIVIEMDKRLTALEDKEITRIRISSRWQMNSDIWWAMPTLRYRVFSTLG
jgi:hypothetical protein